MNDTKTKGRTPADQMDEWLAEDRAVLVWRAADGKLRMKVSDPGEMSVSRFMNPLRWTADTYASPDPEPFTFASVQPPRTAPIPFV